MMTLFDAPDRESSCVRRSRTSTSLQSLGMFNETQRIEIGRKLAERLIRENDTEEARLNQLFRLLASRPPMEFERKACLGLLGNLKVRYANTESEALELLAVGEASVAASLNPNEIAAWAQVCVMVLASDIAILLY